MSEGEPLSRQATAGPGIETSAGGLPADGAAWLRHPSREPMSARGKLLVLVLFAAGVALRWHDLGELSVTGDEIYTIGEAETALTSPELRTENETWRLRWGQRTNPLHLWLTQVAMHLVDEPALAARLFPFAFGILAMIVLPLLLTRIAGRRAGLVLLALLTFSPMHIDYSRLARYQSAAFLFGGICLLCTLQWFSVRNFRCGLVAILAGALATLSHVTSFALVASVVLSLMLFGRPGKKAYATLGALLAAAGGAFFEKIRRTVLVIREGIPRPFGAPPPWRILASIAYSMGPLVAFAALWQCLHFVRRRDRIGLALMTSVAVPMAGLLFLSQFYDVGPRYFAAICAGVMLLAALALSGFSAGRPDGQGRRTLVLTTVVCLSLLPTVVSDQIDGQRYDFRSVAARLQETAGPSDLILAKWHSNLEFYLPRETHELTYDLDALDRQIRASDAARAHLVLQAQRGRLVFPGQVEDFFGRFEPYLLARESFFQRRLDDRLYRFELQLLTVDAAALRAATDRP